MKMFITVVKDMLLILVAPNARRVSFSILSNYQWITDGSEHQKIS